MGIGVITVTSRGRKSRSTSGGSCASQKADLQETLWNSQVAARFYTPKEVYGCNSYVRKGKTCELFLQPLVYFSNLPELAGLQGNFLVRIMVCL